MKSFALLVFMAVAVIPANAQGVRLSSDFFPLAVGNRWTYTISTEDGKKLSESELSIADHQIIRGRSFYVLTDYPFVADPTEKIRLIGYDRQEREFVRMVNDKEGPLFLSDGSAVETLEQDAAGLPQRIRLRLDTMTLTFQRGIGIVEARIETASGIRLVKMSLNAVGEARPARSTSGTAPAAPELAVNPNDVRRPGVVSPVTADNPKLTVMAEPVPQGFQITFTVFNTAERLLPFRFPSGQTFDLVIVNAAGEEVWRWSQDQFFTAVVRSEALRPQSAWKYQAVWNGKDKVGVAVPPGVYHLTARLTTDPSMEAPAIVLTIP